MDDPPRRAPEIDRPGLTWLGDGGAVRLASRRGRLTLLAFRSLERIACRHLSATLRRVEARFPDRVNVIHVLGAGSLPEKHRARAEAVRVRQDLGGSALFDPDLLLARLYGVGSWPTLVFVDPQGVIAGTHAGEPDPDGLIEAVSAALDAWAGAGMLVPAEPQRVVGPPIRFGRLRFPARVKPDGSGGAFLVADRGNHQVVLIDAAGTERARYGDGTAGFMDGPASKARFLSPEGLIATDEAFLIADTGNHALRRIDRVTGAVTTLAGTGARGGVLREPRAARTTALASPCDLDRLSDGRIVIANAGTHQIVAYDPVAATLTGLAGTGMEGSSDGPAGTARLAQPVGLAAAPDDRLYVTESASSALRVVTADPASWVATLIAPPPVEVDHRDGSWDQAAMRRPVACAVLPDGRLAVVDSDNDRLRIVDPALRRIDDLGGGFACLDPLRLPLFAPGGVAPAAGNRIVVADTNNHRLVLIDPVAQTVQTLFA